MKNKTDLTQLDRLQELLRSEKTLFHVARYDQEPEFCQGFAVKAERHQIVVLFPDGTRLWDAICHPGSYGYEAGLLEVMGDPVLSDPRDYVEGDLTADEIYKRWQKWKNGRSTCDHSTNAH